MPSDMSSLSEQSVESLHHYNCTVKLLFWFFSLILNFKFHVKLVFYPSYVFLSAIDLKDRANEIYKRVEDQKSSRGRNQDALLAACLYIACRQEDKPRTVKGTFYDSFNI